MNLKILLTGADGFIGKYLVSKLKKLGYDVTGISKRECDITNKKVVKNLFKEKNFGIIFHLAAFTPQKLEEEKDFENLFSVNVLGTLNLLETSLEKGVKKFIYSSSSSVYNRQDISIPAKEEYVSPENIYGISKLAGENLCEIFRKKHKLKTISLRYSSVYGFGQKEGSVLPIFIEKALKDEDIVIFGKGERTQDFIYVEDVVEANIKSVFSKTEGVFNIGSGKETSMIELAKTILEVFSESKSQIIKKQVDNYNEGRFFLNIQKARKELGFVARYSLKEGLRKYKKMIYENRYNC